MHMRFMGNERITGPNVNLMQTTSATPKRSTFRIDSTASRCIISTLRDVLPIF